MNEIDKKLLGLLEKIYDNDDLVFLVMRIMKKIDKQLLNTLKKMMMLVLRMLYCCLFFWITREITPKET